MNKRRIQRYTNYKMQTVENITKTEYINKK